MNFRTSSAWWYFIPYARHALALVSPRETQATRCNGKVDGSVETVVLVMTRPRRHNIRVLTAKLPHAGVSIPTPRAILEDGIARYGNHFRVGMPKGVTFEDA